MRRLTLTLMLAGTLAVSGFAQINARRENQQDRIAQGVQSGQLTPRETAHLEGREARVNREIRNDRRADDGRLTSGERARITRQQNRLSNSIYADKHNAAVGVR